MHGRIAHRAGLQNLVSHARMSLAAVCSRRILDDRWASCRPPAAQGRKVPSLRGGTLCSGGVVLLLRRERFGKIHTGLHVIRYCPQQLAFACSAFRAAHWTFAYR